MSPKPKSGLFPRLSLGRKCRSCKLKGKMQNVIVVKPPNPMFRQAVFFLRDDYFLSSDISHEELMKQANSAASSFVGQSVPKVRTKKSLIIIPAALILFSGILLLVLYLI